MSPAFYSSVFIYVGKCFNPLELWILVLRCWCVMPLYIADITTIWVVTTLGLVGLGCALKPKEVVTTLVGLVLLSCVVGAYML